MSCLSRVMERVTNSILYNPIKNTVQSLVPDRYFAQFSKKIEEGVQFIGSLHARKIIKLSIIGLLPKLVAANVDQSIFFENADKTAFFNVKYDSYILSDIENIQSICGFNQASTFSSPYSPNLIEDEICTTTGAHSDGMANFISTIDLYGYNTTDTENYCMQNSLSERYCKMTSKEFNGAAIISGIAIFALGIACCAARSEDPSQAPINVEMVEPFVYQPPNVI